MTHRRLRKLPGQMAGLLLAGCLSLAPGQAQNLTDSRFTYVLPWDDATPGTVNDLSGLNAKPAGVHGRIVVKDGHFVESGTGRRIRFFGINFCAQNDFPTHSDADKVAAHLAKLGFNVVRIHHADSNGSPLWDKKAPGRHTFDAEAIDRLDYLIGALKQQGIYSNVNLHVSRTFWTSDGFPEGVKQLPGKFNKRIDHVDRRMIALQKDFARDMLTHVNPYTGLSYAADPAVAFVEINNENSLIHWNSPQERFDYFENLPEPFRGDILQLWNTWLSQKYGSDEALKAAWKNTAPLPEAGTGAAEPLSQAKWGVEDVEKTVTWSEEPAGAGLTPTLTAANSQVTENPWHAQAQLLPVNLRDGQTYAVTFRARADKSRTLPLYASVKGGDWHGVGLRTQARLSTDWQDFRFTFQADKVDPQNNRVVFVLGNDTGSVWLNNVQVSLVVPVEVPEGQSLAARNLGVPLNGTAGAKADWNRFLVATDRQYTDEMLRYLRDDLKVQANITNTQISYGELGSLYAEAGSDFADNHAYWQHPEFPSEKWDANNWKMEQSSMVSALAAGKSTALNRLGFQRVAGKPYTVSEFCIPAPSFYQVEMYPVIASYAALQDWDAIYHFDFGDYGEAVPSNRIQSFFALNGNPLKGSFAAAAALLFRQGAMTPLGSISTLKVSQDAIMVAKGFEPEWTAANGGQKVDLLRTQLQLSPTTDGSASSLVQNQAAGQNKAGAQIIQLKSGAVFLAQGEGAISATGFVGGDTVRTTAASFEFPEFGDNHAGMILAGADGKALQDSSRLLLTLGSKAENTGMGWNADRTSVANNWGTAPTLVEGIPVTVTLKNKLVRHVWALDATGARVQEVPVERNADGVQFVLGPHYQTLNYELSG